MVSPTLLTLLHLSLCVLAAAEPDTHFSWAVPPRLQYPYCDAPEFPQTPKNTATGSSTLSTFEDAKFLSFEEWKAQNLQEAMATQDTKTPQTSTDHAQGTMPVAVNMSNEPRVMGPDTPDPTFDASIPAQHSSAVLERNRKIAENPQSHVVQKKERFNHASFDCAASIVQSNRESKGSSNILKENKDYYMLNVCGAASKFVIIELCNDILVDNLQMANFEYFSGVFKEVKVQISSKFPPGREGWQTLGNFKARHVREIQSFHFENPLIWARYVKIDFLSFYGNEFYCPLSLVRVYGKTMMEDYKQEGSQESDDENYPAVSEDAKIEVGEVASQPVNDIVEVNTAPVVPPTAQDDKISRSVSGSSTTSVTGTAINAAVEILHTAISTIVSTATSSKTRLTQAPKASHSLATVCAAVPTTLAFMSPALHYKDVISPGDVAKRESRVLNSTYSTPATHNSSSSLNGTLNVAANNTVEAINGSSDGKGHASRLHISTPPTQESIYKQITKRLTLLEANATMSLKYIESQSALLANSFTQLSSKQARYLENFLDNVNSTLLQRTAQLNHEYERLYRDALNSVEAARHRQERDIAFVSRRLALLGDDLTFFKRLGIFQSFLMIVLMGFLITSRGSRIETQLHRVLSGSNSPWLSSPGRRSPRLWRTHFRSSSIDADSIYSFPVDQIERPDAAYRSSPPESPAIGRDDNALGIKFNRERNRTPNTEPIRRVRLPLITRQSTSATKDDMYGADLSSAIRRRLFREPSWSSAVEELQVESGEKNPHDEALVDQHDMGAHDYPTPTAEEDNNVEPRVGVFTTNVKDDETIELEAK